MGVFMLYMLSAICNFLRIDWVRTTHLHQALLKTWENCKEKPGMIKIAFSDNARGQTYF